MIALIKASPNPAAAKEALLDRTWPPGMVTAMLERTDSTHSRPDNVPASFGLHQGQYHLTEVQAQAILDLKLHRLTGLEQDKILAEYEQILQQIAEYMRILSDDTRLMEVIREELEEVKSQFGDARRTEIITTKQDYSTEDLISEEDVAVTLSHAGYVKSQTLDQYQAQRRGGKGKSAANVKEEDFISRLVITNTHDTILCFSSRGKVYWLKVYQLPQVSRGSRGRPIVNLLPLEADERINTILPLREFKEEHYVFMATKFGTVKKVALQHFSRPRANGIIALELNEGDCLVGAVLTDGQSDVMIFSDAGKVIRFAESVVRPMGRTARGVRGIKLAVGQSVIQLIRVEPAGAILTATANGYGKRTEVSEYRITGRGGQGVISVQVTERNGAVVSAIQVEEDDEVMLITDQGTLVRTRAAEISLVGRNTQGVRLINVSKDEHLVGLQKIEE